jgi:ankyrin repeat protein
MAVHPDVPLHVAVANGRTDVPNILVHEGADTSCVDDESWTTYLRFAMDARDDAMARLLLDNGDSITAKTLRGDTPLLLALRKSQRGILRLYCSMMRTLPGFLGVPHILRWVNLSPLKKEVISKGRKQKTVSCNHR